MAHPNGAHGGDGYAGASEIYAGRTTPSGDPNYVTITDGLYSVQAFNRSRRVRRALALVSRG